MSIKFRFCSDPHSSSFISYKNELLASEGSDNIFLQRGIYFSYYTIGKSTVGKLLQYDVLWQPVFDLRFRAAQA